MKLHPAEHFTYSGICEYDIIPYDIRIRTYSVMVLTEDDPVIIAKGIGLKLVKQVISKFEHTYKCKYAHKTTPTRLDVIECAGKQTDEALSHNRIAQLEIELDRASHTIGFMSSRLYCKECHGTDESPPQHCQDCPHFDDLPENKEGVGCKKCGFTGYACQPAHSFLSKSPCPKCNHVSKAKRKSNVA